MSSKNERGRSGFHKYDYIVARAETSELAYRFLAKTGEAKVRVDELRSELNKHLSVASDETNASLTMFSKAYQHPLVYSQPVTPDTLNEIADTLMQVGGQALFMTQADVAYNDIVSHINECEAKRDRDYATCIANVFELAAEKFKLIRDMSTLPGRAAIIVKGIIGTMIPMPMSRWNRIATTGMDVYVGNIQPPTEGFVAASPAAPPPPVLAQQQQQQKG
jgi:hypothetical protein